MGDISLSKAVRSNLLSLQSTASMMAKTQERLATGNKVNSALDNPTNFFTAQGLNSRAGDLNQLEGLSRAEFTLLPVARRFCVVVIMSAVLLSERRLDRTAFEREISAIYAILAMGPSRPLAQVLTAVP